MVRKDLCCRGLLMYSSTVRNTPPPQLLGKVILLIPIFRNQNSYKLYQPFHFSSTTLAMSRALIIKMLYSLLVFDMISYRHKG